MLKTKLPIVYSLKFVQKGARITIECKIPHIFK